MEQKQKGRIMVYSIVGCPHCMRAKSSLREQGLRYVDVGVDLYAAEVRDKLVQMTGGKTSVPQIFFNERYVGGNKELNELISASAKWQEIKSYVLSTPPPPGTPEVPDVSLAKHEEAAGMVMQCEADEYALLISQMKADGLINSKFSGLFSKAKQGFSGKDFVRWMKETKHVDEAKALEIGQALLDQHFSQSSGNEFKNSSTVYSLIEDTYSHALNASQFECAVGSATEVGEELRKLILKLFSVYLSSDGMSVDYKAMSQSKEFALYERLSAQLQRVDLSKLSRDEKVAFFINVYNAMVIHATIKKGPPTWLWARYKFFYQTFYIISGELYSLQDIENGILRGNKKGVGMLRVPFQADDPRKEIALQQAEPLIHFALNCGAKSCPPIKTFSAIGLKDQLETAAYSFLESEENCDVDETSGVVTLSEIFKWYRSDFGSTDLEVTEFVLKYVREEKKRERLQGIVKSGKVKIKYRPYDWGHNGKT